MHCYIDAKREIEKQTGGALMDLDQNIQSMAARPRRPGILRFDQCFLLLIFCYIKLFYTYMYTT